MPFTRAEKPSAYLTRRRKPSAATGVSSSVNFVRHSSVFDWPTISPETSAATCEPSAPAWTTSPIPTSWNVSALKSVRPFAALKSIT